MKCPKCGSENDAGARFCERCGLALPPRDQASPAAPLPSPEDVGVPAGRDVSGGVAAGKPVAQVDDVHGGKVTIGQRIADFFSGSGKQRRALRNRRAMLELVRNTWIRGVLERSLHGVAMAELGLEERADGAEHPWDVELQVPGQPKRLLPSGTQIVDVFDEVGRALVILGEPGSGRTTTLLELARDAIARAKGDLAQPIPVVFNLSSWAEGRRPIAEWLVEELSAKYHVPKKIACPWVENDALLLLLDGLDEVKAERRRACVTAIGDFRREHGSVPLVICGRIADDEALTTRLGLGGAVLLQPLTPQQVDQYLDRAGAELAAAREALQQDAALQELVRTPLMLDLMALAYRGASVEDLQLDDTAETRRGHLLDAYVRRMFERRRAEHAYPRERAVHWLAWLARQMSAHAQTVFLLEGLQPDWLPARARRAQRWVCRVARLVWGLVLWLVVGLATGLPYGLMVGRQVVWSEVSEIHVYLSGGFGPAAGPDVGLIVGLVVGLAVGLFYGLLGLLFLRLDSVATVKTLRWSWREGLKGLGVGLIAGPTFGLAYGLALGLGMGLAAMLVCRLVYGPEGLILGLFFGLGYGFIFLVLGLVLGVVVGLVSGLVSGLAGGLAVMLVGGLGYTGVKTKTVPNQGVRRSAKNALIGGSFIGLVVGLAFGLVVGLLFALSFGLAYGLLGLFFGLVLGLISGMGSGLGFYGGSSVILHLLLRYFLHRYGYLPWRLISFLDYAAERTFLRKVGGGYIFVHPLLQEHFASL